MTKSQHVDVFAVTLWLQLSCKHFLARLVVPWIDYPESMFCVERIMLELSLLLPGAHYAVPGNAGRLSVDEYFPHIKNVGAERIPFTLFMDATGCGNSLCNRLGLT